MSKEDQFIYNDADKARISAAIPSIKRLPGGSATQTYDVVLNPSVDVTDTEIFDRCNGGLHFKNSTFGGKVRRSADGKSAVVQIYID